MPLLLLPPPTPTANAFPSGLGPLPAAWAVEWSPTTDPFETPVWEDVTSRVFEFSTRRGRNHELDRFEAGTARIRADNSDRHFDRYYTAGPNFGNLLPFKAFRIRGQNAAVTATHPVFFGYGESYQQSYQPPEVADVTITLVDAFKMFALQFPKSPWSLQIDNLAPTAWLRMGEAGTESMLDSSANAYDGLYYNSPTLGVAGLVQSDVNTAVQFTAASMEYAQITSIPAYTQWHGVEGWFSTSASAAQTLAMWGDSAGRPLIGIEMDASGHLDFVEYYINGNQTNHRVTTDTYNDGVAHFVALGVVPNGGFAAVIDDQAVLQGVTLPGFKRFDNSPVAGVEFTTATNTWTFGQRGNGTQFFDGTLDEWVIYVDDVWSPTVSNGAELFDGFRDEMLTHHTIGQSPWVDDLIDERADHLLDSIDYPASERSFGVGTVPFQAADFGTNTLLAEFHRMNSTEFGRLFVGADGKLVIQSRYSSLGVAASVTLSDEDIAGVHHYREIVIDDDDSLIYNMVVATRSGGSDLQVSDEASIRAYGTRSYVASDLLYQDDDSTRSFAHVVLNRYKDPIPRISRLALDLTTADSETVDAILGLEIGDVATVERRPQGIGAPISQSSTIEGIEVHVAAGSSVPRFDVVFELMETTASEFWVLGNTQAGVLGTTTNLGA